jgi:hypothetical protein
MVEKKGRWRTRTRIGNPNFVGVKLYENRTGRKYCCRPSSSLFSNPASVLRIQATVATGVERKKEVTNNSAGKSRLLTPGQFLLDRLTQDIGVSSSGAMEELELERGVCNPFRKYTPERVRQRVLESPGALFSVISRGFEIITSLGLYWAAISYDCLVGRGEEMVPRRAEQLRTLLCDLGPSFIKAGQVMMNRGKASSCLFFSMVNMVLLLSLQWNQSGQWLISSSAHSGKLFVCNNYIVLQHFFLSWNAAPINFRKLLLFTNPSCKCCSVVSEIGGKFRKLRTWFSCLVFGLFVPMCRCWQTGQILFEKIT